MDYILVLIGIIVGIAIVCYLFEVAMGWEDSDTQQLIIQEEMNELVQDLDRSEDLQSLNGKYKKLVLFKERYRQRCAEEMKVLVEHFSMKREELLETHNRFNRTYSVDAR